MALRSGIIKANRAFNLGVSYRLGEIGEKLFDASNLIHLEGKLSTRYGLHKFNTASFSTNPLSLSFYKKFDDSTRKIILKTDSVLKAASEDGVFADIKTGLTSTTTHDAVTMSGRHILAIGSDGLFSYDGTTVAPLGVSAPTAPTTAVAAGGALTDKTYQVAVTYVCSSTGFESNQGAASANVTTNSGAGNSTIAVTAIPVSTHPLVDKKNIYLKNVSDSGNFLLVTQIDAATTTLNIVANPASNALSPPTGKDVPVAGGGKYLAIFNGALCSAGSSTYPSDCFFSNPNEPDGWSTLNSLVHAQGDGPITGLAVGNYRNQEITQYLVIFKRKSLTVYYQSTAGAANDTETFIDGVGCVSHKTIKVKDGNIYFLSDQGWRVFSQGALVSKTLADGDIDDIFQISGWTYGINKTAITSAFSAYYSELDTYLTWVSEGSSTSFDKCYAYNLGPRLWDGQFMPQQFSQCTCACAGEDTNGNSVIFIGRSDRNIYTYSIRNPFYDDTTSNGFVLDVSQLDVDKLQAEGTTSIPVSATLNWAPNDDFDATFNYRNFFLEAISETSAANSAVTMSAYLNFSRTISTIFLYNFFATEGFQLDVSRLDVDILADDRTRSRQFADINKTGRNILINISQNVKGARLQLLASQLNYSKNGNSNL